MKPTKAMIGSLAAAAAIGGIAGAAPGHSEPVEQTTVTGCAVRFAADGPAIHENEQHRCTGAVDVEVVDGDLVVHQSVRAPVSSISADEDETLAERGIVAGASGGNGRTIVRFHDAMTGRPIPADSRRLQGQYANLWLTWVQTS